jgi:hypothetical protein
MRLAIADWAEDTNDIPRELDEKRMAWAMGDIIANRQSLSRWHPDYSDTFAAFIDIDN